MENYLTCRDLMSRFKVSRSHIYDLIATQNFPRPTKVGGASRWAESRVLAWIKEREGGAA
jgi:predicted DNA-binding transcriptional regulator AlpA